MDRQVWSTDPWSVDDSNYPRNGTVSDKLAFCLHYAVMAPSIHNTQPWRFRIADNAIELLADRSNALPATDPDGRELIISCGAALMNLLTALHHFGHETWVQYEPDPQHPDTLARVRLGRERFPDAEDGSLFRGIRRRRSSRQPFQARPIPRALQRRMIWLASEHGCWLYFIESEQGRSQILSLVEEAHTRRQSDLQYQSERAHWLGYGDPPSGIAQKANVAEIVEPTDEVDPRHSKALTLENASRWIERDRELLRSTATIVLLGTDRDATFNWIQAGQAVQKILLRAASEEISTSFLHQPCQIPELREQLRHIAGREGPVQSMLRLGYGNTVYPHSPRLSVEQVLLPNGP